MRQSFQMDNEDHPFHVTDERYCKQSEQSSAYRAEPPDKHEQIVRTISNQRNDMNELQLAHYFISLSITLYRHCLSFITHK
jgi:hypothetical protein